MSLLNEALRKNKSENSQKIKFDFHAKDTQSSKRKVLIILIPCIVLISGIIFAWANLSNDSKKSEIIIRETVMHDSVPVEVKVPEPEVFEPEAVEEPVKQQENSTDSSEQEVVHIASIKSAEPVINPSRREVPEVQIKKEKEEKTPEVSNKENVDNGENYYKKAIQFHRQGRLELAAMMYKKALSFNPENYDALFNLASIYITVSRYSDAYNILIKLLTDNPADSEIILNLAVSEIGLGKNRDALSHLQKVNEEDRELQFRVSFHKGVVLSRLGDQNEALRNYKNAEKLNPDYPSLLLNIAVLYDRLGNYPESIGYYSKLINSDLSGSREKDKFKQRIETLQNNVSKSSLKNSPRSSNIRGIDE